eukprot:gnl/TRDRNA2_/TRDRNA2_128437_c4_seq1.p1 gnl/TRDRNA2_/TRDRNA2_128437_c4~~gnl/TRDRNA2_/TRDRNA2_128437_c4_seq1.p1  ORF type:complete len:429 (+),score=64.76 gnl/TRDRNA2_/TRDRNA2_128437_c4_seq1:2-1288(+)
MHASAKHGVAASTIMWKVSVLAAAMGTRPPGNEECWKGGFTREQCCNAIFGPSGNWYCWDDGKHTFETCCGGVLYRAPNCREFVTHFSFASAKFSVGRDTMETCASAMDSDPIRCNSPNTTLASCPVCAKLGQHVVRYIRCIRQEQQWAGVTEGKPSLSVVGGAQYPTILRPKFPGRDFTIVAPAFDACVGSQLLVGGRWMLFEERLLTGLLSTGGVVVDAGANIGGFTMPLARHVGPGGEVHAFEPFRLLHQILTANCAVNGLLSCFTYQRGLGRAAASKKLKMPGLNAIGNPSKMYVADSIASEMHIHFDSQLEETVHVMRLDDLPLQRLDLIKIDVESMELDLLIGAEQTLRRFQPILYVEDSEAADLVNMRGETRLIKFLSEKHAYICINLAQSGISEMTSLLCAPNDKIGDVRQRLQHIPFNL